MGFVIAFCAVAAETIAVGARVPRFSPRALIALPFLLGAMIGLAFVPASVPAIVPTAAVTITLLTFGSVAGGVVGSAIDKPGYLIVVAVVSSMVDAFSVLHPSGPTAQIVELEAAVNVLVLPFPFFGTTRIEPVLGVGDVTFVAIYFAACRRHGLPMVRTIVGLTIAFVATMIAVLVLQRGIPALPFLGAGVVLAHPQARALPEEDRRRAAIGIVGIAVALLAIALAAR
ncbi:MAG: hypothetical protein AB7S26_06790 [Sandaracinaceae bacterium]